jgi:hypothetical protein
LKKQLLSLSRNNVPEKKRGAILFVAVGAIAVLSILAVATTSSVLQELKLARFVTDSNTSCYVASSVVEAMKVVWINDPMTQAMTLYRLRDRQIPLGDKVAFVSFSDEQSKINISKSSREIQLRLPGLSGNETLADSIRAANPAAKQELLLLEGMTKEIYDPLKDSVTTWGGGSVNINTASEATLAYLGLDQDLIRKIKEFRAGNDGVEATEDDRIFSNTGEIVPSLESAGLTPEQKTLLESLVSSGQFTTNSSFIDINIAVKRGNKQIRTFKIILDFNSGKIVQWGEE